MKNQARLKARQSSTLAEQKGALDLSDLSPEQEEALREAFRFLRKRAAWFRAQKDVASQGLEDADALVENVLIEIDQLD